MDFLDPRKKRAHKIRLYIGYALMACVLVIGSTIVFFEARGFDIDRKTGEIIQNGLVFVNAHPEPATVYVNGKREGQTDTRLTIPTGDYTFEFTRDGYRNWQRSFHLDGSTIERLDYVFMFPEQLDTAAIRNYSAPPPFASQSPDRKWLLVQQPGNFLTFDVFDLSNQDDPAVTSFTLPASLMNRTAGGDKLELVEWSTNNRHVLVRHTFKGGSEFILIDRQQPTESLNLNSHFNVPIHKIALRDKKFDKFHILDKPGGTLRFADSRSREVTDLAEQVFSFKSYSDNVIFYVTGAKAEKGKVNVNIRRGDKTYTVRELTAGARYPIDITRYDDEWFMAVGSDTDAKAYVYHEVFRDLDRQPSRSPSPVAVFRVDDLAHIAVSANTRFISAQGGSRFAVYDAEHDRRYQYDTKLKFSDGQKATWMDGHRLTAVIDGKLRAWDYDGINMQTLVSANPAYLPFYDRDYDFLYTIAPSSQDKAESTLTKTPMRTPADL